MFITVSNKISTYKIVFPILSKIDNYILVRAKHNMNMIYDFCISTWLYYITIVIYAHYNNLNINKSSKTGVEHNEATLKVED